MNSCWEEKVKMDVERTFEKCQKKYDSLKFAFVKDKKHISKNCKPRTTLPNIQHQKNLDQ